MTATQIEQNTHDHVDLTLAERSSFKLLMEHLGQVIETIEHDTPEMFEDAKACLEINSDLNHLDLQAPKIAELKAERDKLVGEFLDHPYEAFMAEVITMARLCEDRSMVSVDYDGLRTTQFVTRDPERKKADLHFRILEYKSGLTELKAEVPLRGGLYGDGEDQSFFITASSTGDLSVEQRLYRRGQYQYKDLPLEPGGMGLDRLKTFFMYSTEAIHLSYTRQSEERAAADAQAKKFLREKLLHANFA